MTGILLCPLKTQPSETGVFGYESLVEGGFEDDESIEFHEGSEGLGIEAGRGGNAGRGDLP